MEEISVEDKKYLKAKVIARELGYTADYVGQLCRAGKVNAKLVGRTWYVDPTSIKGHKKNRYRSSKVATKRELKTAVASATQMQAEVHSPKVEHFYKTQKEHVPVRYETDESDLVPSPQKATQPVELPVELADAEKVSVVTKGEQHFNFAAPKRTETKFFGTLKVTEFMTEVAVTGEDEPPEVVSVRDNHVVKEKVKAKKPQKVAVDSATHKVMLRHATHKNPPPMEAQNGPDKNEALAIPVTGTSEIEKLPLRYHLVTFGAVVTATVIAVVFVGLETTVTASVESISTQFSFAIKNLSALIFFAK